MRAEADRDRARPVVLGDGRVHERLRGLVDPVEERLPDTGDHDEPADRGEHGEDADRDEHRDRSLAVALVCVLLHELAGLAAEDREVEAEGVEAGQERPDEPGCVQEGAESVIARERGGHDAVLRPEAGEDRNPRERERTGEERDVRPRHDVLEPAHLADVLLAAQVMDHDPRAT